jgi:hypothetical protein
MEKAITMFNRIHLYDFDFELKYDIEAINELIQKITEPFILSYCGLDVIDFYIQNDEHFLGNDCVRWIYELTKDKTNTIGDIRQCILVNSVEDIDWTKQRNEGLTGIFYRKAIFKEEIQKLFINELISYKKEAEQMFREWTAEQNVEKLEKEKRKNAFTIIKVYQHVNPSGGEDGIDGYYDADITDGINICRMVARNVFDFGYYTYPKRVEGTNGVFKHQEWSELENKISNWLTEFSPFTTWIRM